MNVQIGGTYNSSRVVARFNKKDGRRSVEGRGVVVEQDERCELSSSFDGGMIFY